MVAPWSCWNERSGAFTADGQSDRFELCVGESADSEGSEAEIPEFEIDLAFSLEAGNLLSHSGCP
jgi:hypothetical protein